MFENLMNEAQSLLGQTSPQQVGDATRDHVEQTDPNELAQHLAQGAQGMDGGQLSTLGRTLLGALANRGHDESQVRDGGVDAQAVQNGDRQNVVALIEHAQQNPGALRDAAVQFVHQNPQVLQQLPGLLQGVLGRLRG
jgi:hypothetical protein